MQDSLFQAQLAEDIPKLVPTQLLNSISELRPTLRINMQQDAHEFLHVMLDILDHVVLDANRMHCHLEPKALGSPVPGSSAKAGRGGRPPETGSGYAGSWDSKVHAKALASHIFGGMLQSDITCKCGNVSTRREPFMDVPVDFGHGGSGRHHEVGAFQAVYFSWPARISFLWSPLLMSQASSLSPEVLRQLLSLPMNSYHVS
jgi:hypothetical protein